MTKRPRISDAEPIRPWLRLDDVLALTGWSEATLRRKIKAEEFPKSVQRGRWRGADVDRAVNGVADDARPQTEGER